MPHISIIQSLYLILPLMVGGFLHAVIIKKDIFPGLSKPIDFGKKYRGKRIFGAHKTWRGLVFYSTSTALLTLLQAKLYNSGTVTSLSYVEFNVINGFVLGLSLGALNSIAELPNSFVKRQLSIGSGAVSDKRQLLQYMIDQIDSPLVLSSFLFLVGILNLNSAIIVFLVGTFVHATVDHFMYYKKGIKSWDQSEPPWAKVAYWILQAVTIPLWKFLIFGVFRAKVNTNSSIVIKKSHKYILYSNHQSILDAAALSVALSARNVIKLLPFRYITANVHYEHPVKGYMFRIAGGYPAKLNSKNEGYGIERSVHLLNHGQTLIFFPEGTRTRKRLPAKRGLREISKKSNPTLVPVYVSWARKSFLNRRVAINIGSPFKYNGQTSEVLLDKVYDLNNKHTKQQSGN